MERLTEHFAAWEMRCRCCGKLRVDPRLMAALEELRAYVGCPVFVNSGYRCAQHNAEVGGEPLSLHLVGRAADIVVQGYGVGGMELAALAVPAFARGGIASYYRRGFIHVDVREKKWRSTDDAEAENGRRRAANRKHRGSGVVRDADRSESLAGADVGRGR